MQTSEAAHACEVGQALEFGGGFCAVGVLAVEAVCLGFEVVGCGDCAVGSGDLGCGVVEVSPSAHRCAAAGRGAGGSGVDSGDACCAEGLEFARLADSVLVEVLPNQNLHL